MSDAPPPVKPGPLYTYLLSPAEKAASTFAEQFSIYVLPLLVIVNGKLAISGSQLLAVTDMAGFAALISVITSAATFALVIHNPWVDLVWRVGKTYLQSFLGVLATTALVPSLLHTNWPIALIGAIPVAGTALIKGIVAIMAPWSVMAGFVPRSLAIARPEPKVHAPEHERARDAEVPEAFRNLDE